MERGHPIDDFSLLGGPLHRLGVRLGLVRNGTHTVALGLALGVGSWLVLAALLLIQGEPERLASLATIAGSVRLLLAIPLAFACETLVAPRATDFVRSVVDSGVVPARDLPALGREIARTRRWKDSWVGDALCLGLAALAPMFATGLMAPGTTGSFDPARASGGMTAAGAWYGYVCMVIFRFVLLRWVLKLALWWYFLWRLSRLDLRLVPTHPDLAGGLGDLELVHLHFLPLALGLSAVEAAGFAEAIGTGALPFEACYPAFGLVLLVNAVLFFGPLFFFTRRLWACRVNGYIEYMQLASNYVRGFDRKWLREPPGAESLLGTSDIQSLADLSNSVTIVRNMRFVPLSIRTSRDFIVTALVPALPLLLLKYPAAELVARFFARLSGL